MDINGVYVTFSFFLNMHVMYWWNWCLEYDML